MALDLATDDLKRLAQGDQATFKRVYAAYASLVHYVAVRHGVSREEADDVVQETFLKLHRHAAEIRDGTRVKAWLVTSARNLAVDRLRARQRRRIEASPDALDTVSEAMWSNDGSAMHEAELLLVRELVERIAKAPGGETFRAFYIEGLSAKEIAAQNGEAISTVTTRLSRLRERFGAELRQHIEALRAQE